MKIREIIQFLEEKAPLKLQESYDNSGLLVGDEEWELANALISLDCTEAVVDEAIKKNCGLIISHHPILFKGLKKLNGKNYVERVIIKAIQNNIALYAIHTNLDNVLPGVNSKIAETLGLEQVQVLQAIQNQVVKLTTFVPHDHVEKVSEAIFKAGGGQIGTYDSCSFRTLGTGTFKANEGSNPFVGSINQLHTEPETRLEMVVNRSVLNSVVQSLKEAHPYEEVAYDIHQIEQNNSKIGAGIIGQFSRKMEESYFIEFLKDKLNLEVIRASAYLNKPIQKVAICGGSGSFLLAKAKAMKAEAYISADFKYHEFFDAEGQILIADIGHYESEVKTIDLIHDWLREKFPTFALLKTQVKTNPIKYL